jgi:hypothetical protein
MRDAKVSGASRTGSGNPMNTQRHRRHWYSNRVVLSASVCDALGVRMIAEGHVMGLVGSHVAVLNRTPAARARLGDRATGLRPPI